MKYRQAKKILNRTDRFYLFAFYTVDQIDRALTVMYRRRP